MHVALLLVSGLTALVIGAELLVRGASRLAAAIGVSPLVIGLTIVAFGTSAPELAVSIGSAWSGRSEIAVGNAVGSNIFNILFILGASALVLPLTVAERLVRREVPLMIGSACLLLLLVLDGGLGRLDGALLFALAVAYTTYLIVGARAEGAEASAEFEREFGVTTAAAGQHWAVQVALIVAGLILLVVGSSWLVEGAVAVARLLGLSELVIGLTIVAVGTSLPEAATSIAAAVKGERDIAVGNVVGSNIFNVLVVLGVSALVSPSGLVAAPTLARFDIPVMIAVSVACLPIFFSGYRIDRWEGGLFFVYYLLYAAYLVLAATDHDALAPFATTVAAFVLPLTALTLIVIGYRELRTPS